MYNQHVHQKERNKRDIFFSEAFSWNKIPLAVVVVEERTESCNYLNFQPTSNKIDCHKNFMMEAWGLAVGSPQFKSVQIPH